MTDIKPPNKGDRERVSSAPYIEKVHGTIYRFTCPVCRKVYESMYMSQLMGIAYGHMSKHEQKEKESRPIRDL